MSDITLAELEALRKEAKLNPRVEGGYLEAIDRRLPRLAQTIRMQHEALEAVEWSSLSFELEAECPSCHYCVCFGHADDCPLAAALSAARKLIGDTEGDGK